MIDETRKLKSLPKLKIVSDKYISQKMVDDIVEYLEKEHLYRLENAVENIKERHGLYFKAFANIASVVYDNASKIMEVPAENLGYIDLCFEISRRIHKAYDLSEPQISGVPIAPNIEGSYMPLAKTEILPSTLEYGWNQATLNSALETFYKEKPELWYLQSEGLRREQDDYIHEPTDYKYFYALIESEFKPKNIEGAKRSFKFEVVQRIREMCKIFPTMSYK